MWRCGRIYVEPRYIEVVIEVVTAVGVGVAGVFELPIAEFAAGFGQVNEPVPDLVFH